MPTSHPADLEVGGEGGGPEEDQQFHAAEGHSGRWLDALGAWLDPRRRIRPSGKLYDADSTKRVTTPNLKIKVQNSHQIEVKVTYKMDPNDVHAKARSHQEHQIEVYVFVPVSIASKASLESVFGESWTGARLKPATVSLQTLARGHLPVLYEFEGAVKRLAADRRPTEEDVANVARLAKFVGYVYRSTLRDTSTAIAKHLKALRPHGSFEGDEEGAWKEGQLPTRVAETARMVEQALSRLRRIGSQLEADETPAGAAQAWDLVDEFTTVEGSYFYMKVLASISQWARQGNNRDMFRTPSSCRPNNLSPTRSPASFPARGGEIPALHLGTPMPPWAGEGDAGRADEGGGAGMAGAVSINAFSLLLPRDAPARNFSAGYLSLHAHMEKRGFRCTPAKDDRNNNEQFTYNLRNLKYGVRDALSLHLQSEKSFLLVDIFGAFFAAIAMGLALVAAWLMAQTQSSQFSVITIIVLIVAYVVKDRTKKLGERYLDSIATRGLGIRVPDKITNIVGPSGQVVGRCTSRERILPRSSLDNEVAKARMGDVAVARVEKVIRMDKEVRLRRRRLQELASEHCDGIHDVMRLNLARLTDRMDVATETHHYLDTESQTVVPIACSRVYHCSIVVRLKLRGPQTSIFHDGDWATVSVVKARIVLDSVGVKRIEQ